MSLSLPALPLCRKVHPEAFGGGVEGGAGEAELVGGIGGVEAGAAEGFQKEVPLEGVGGLLPGAGLGGRALEFRKVVGRQRAFAAAEQGAVQGVAQFPEVALPGQAAEGLGEAGG